MRHLEIFFDDLTNEVKEVYLDFIRAKSRYDINPNIPIAIIRIENESEKRHLTK